MNASVRKRLSAWLSVSILIAGVLAAALSFSLAYQEANELQDTQLQQVAAVLADNAVDNAVRYTPRGGAVDVSIAIEDRDACLVIEDTGPGIEPADIERVFEPFVRVLGSQEPGSGLGLAISRTAAQALGGHIELGKRTDNRSGLRFVYRQARV